VKKIRILGLAVSAMVSAMVSAVVLGVATPAHADQNVSISAHPAAVAAGHTVRISGSVPLTPDCGASDARLTSSAEFFPPDGFGPFVRRSASGEFSFFYTVPASTPPGAYHLGLRCGGGNVGVSAPLRVTGQVTTVPAGGVATGAGGTAGAGRGWWTPLGLAALALATTLLAVRRRLVRRLR
jgi:hypothetical protein